VSVLRRNTKETRYVGVASNSWSSHRLRSGDGEVFASAHPTVLTGYNPRLCRCRDYTELLNHGEGAESRLLVAYHGSGKQRISETKFVKRIPRVQDWDIKCFANCLLTCFPQP
jgi:hypothetical protein